MREGNYIFVFYKSKVSGRWWMSFTKFEEENSKETILPCSYQDYLDSVSGKIPSRMMRILKV